MRYIIVGAGAVGGAIGGRLFQHGKEVVLVARGAQYDALRENGLRLATPAATYQLAIPVVSRPSDLELRGDDVLVLAVKSQDTEAALDAWAAATWLPLVCAQNGVENERIALRRFRRVYAMCVWLPASHVRPGTITAWGAPLTGVLRVGRYPRGVDDLSARIADDLTASACRAVSAPDAMRWKYRKLLSNLGNAVEALCGDQPGTQDVWRHALAEGEAVLAAAGIGHVPEDEFAAMNAAIQVCPVDGDVRDGGSTWQSLVRGRGSIETDFLNGEIVLLGREHDVPTPVNEGLQLLARRFAAEHREAGSLPVAELLGLVGPAA